MKHFALVFLISLAGCAKQAPSPAAASDALLISAACAETDERPYGFILLGTAQAKIYSCAIYDHMACTYAQAGALAAELQCKGDTAAPQGVPAGCAIDASASGAVHYFDTTAELLVADRYICADSGPLKCRYYVHAADVGCDNYDGSTLNDCAANHDNKVREEVICVMDDVVPYLKARPDE